MANHPNRSKRRAAPARTFQDLVDLNVSQYLDGYDNDPDNPITEEGVGNWLDGNWPGFLAECAEAGADPAQVKAAIVAELLEDDA
jgi:hypothetical protein